MYQGWHPISGFLFPNSLVRSRYCQVFSCDTKLSGYELHNHTIRMGVALVIFLVVKVKNSPDIGILDLFLDRPYNLCPRWHPVVRASLKSRLQVLVSHLARCMHRWCVSIRSAFPRTTKRTAPLGPTAGTAPRGGFYLRVLKSTTPATSIRQCPPRAPVLCIEGILHKWDLAREFDQKVPSQAFPPRLSSNRGWKVIDKSTQDKVNDSLTDEISRFWLMLGD